MRQGSNVRMRLYHLLHVRMGRTVKEVRISVRCVQQVQGKNTFVVVDVAVVVVVFVVVKYVTLSYHFWF